MNIALVLQRCAADKHYSLDGVAEGKERKMATGSIGLIVSAVVLVAIVGSSLWNSDDLKRYQELKNKRRFSGKRLPALELEEFDRLARKYWWY